MKPKLLILLLLLCLPLLSACYRQAEEPFQQVDSAEVGGDLRPTSIQEVIEDGLIESDEGEDALAETGQYLTPEPVPGQVEQPTLEWPTETAIAATPPSLTFTPFVRATPTLDFAEALDPDHECVYTVQPGDNLYRLSLSWGTTVQEIMDASQIDDDALSIGQLLLRPGCDYATPEPRPTVEPQPAAGELAEAEGTTVATAEPPTQEPSEPIPSVHVISAGETIESISLKYRVDVNQLISLNNITNPNQLSVGQELLLKES